MYTRALFTAFAIIAICAAITYWFNIRIQPEDIPAYRNLVQESTELRTKHALEEQPAHQKRQGVQKDIWTQDETRHFQIQSKHSELTLSQKRDKVEAIENLTQIQCNTENETLIADQGTYLFPSHQFTAEHNCRLSQNDSCIDGTKIHFDLAKEVITYENPKGTIASGPFKFTAKSLIWEKKEGKIYLSDQVVIEQENQFKVLSDKGELTLNELNPQLLAFEGNVRLFYNESYGVADRLTYDPKEKTLLLTSDRKVLFWQEGLSLSAPEVLIREDKTVEGHGDVHFALDMEEQNYIDELFKQYL